MNRTGLPDFLELKVRQKSLQKHYEKLKEIQSAEPKHFYSRTTPNIKSKTSLSSDRKQEISRNNKILLERITSITQRKPDHPSTGAKAVKSLNFQRRKEQVKKINQENELLAERLRSQKALILKRNLDKDFEKAKKYKEQVSKKKLILFQASLKSTFNEPGRSLTPLVSDDGRTSGFAQRGVSASPLPAPVPYVNRDQFEFSLESDSSYSENFEET
jgi:hypothetical protein